MILTILLLFTLQLQQSYMDSQHNYQHYPIASTNSKETRRYDHSVRTKHHSEAPHFHITENVGPGSDARARFRGRSALRSDTLARLDPLNDQPAKPAKRLNCDKSRQLNNPSQKRFDKKPNTMKNATKTKPRASGRRPKNRKEKDPPPPEDNPPSEDPSETAEPQETEPEPPPTNRFASLAVSSELSDEDDSQPTKSSSEDRASAKRPENPKEPGESPMKKKSKNQDMSRNEKVSEPDSLKPNQSLEKAGHIADRRHHTPSRRVNVRGNARPSSTAQLVFPMELGTSDNAVSDDRKTLVHGTMRFVSFDRL